VNKSTLDLVLASNPQDEAFVVNFSDEAFIDQEFTSNVNKLRDGLGHIESAAARRFTMPWWLRRTSWWPTPSGPNRCWS